MALDMNNEMNKAPESIDAIDRRFVRDALAIHPEWLRDDPQLLSDLGLRLDAANIVDFGPVALSRVSAAWSRESSERQRLEAMAQANFAAQTQTHAAVIDVLKAASLAELAQSVDELARARFGLALGALALEGGDTPPGWFTLVEGQAALLLGDTRPTRLGRVPTAAGLFGVQAPMIESVALARLTLWRPERRGVMAFGSIDPDAFTPDMGSELVTFLARVIEQTAERWPRP
jgi:uncharacterized protein YigA (DUF484 family)